MTRTERTITFREREFKGSRLRCLLLTSQTAEYVAEFCNSLVSPHASVTPDDHWAPRGFLEADEARLGETTGFLREADRDVVTRWWLAQWGRANTPNWDLVSTCRINDGPGLILVEAKAHEAELVDDQCGATNRDNLQQIEKALGEATIAWNALAPGFALSANTHYQLGNRFAFAWKLAKMGVPVVLVYLGFIDAQEMKIGDRVLLKDHTQWRRCVLTRSEGVVPDGVWDKTFHVDGTPLTVLIRSAVVDIDARTMSNASKS
jgi:hypothetical protein